MKMIRLCSYLLAGLFCWLFLTGCISVDIETKAGSDLSGSRTYRITLEPMLARLYRSGASVRMFDFPGQDLEKQKGISVISKQERENEDGSLELVWSYKSGRLENFSTVRDTIHFSKRRHKWWIYYSYYERYLSRNDTNNTSAAGSIRFKNSLTMPGQICSSNGDSLSGSKVVWLRSMDVSARGGLVMIAESKELNQFCLIFLILFILAVIIIIYNIHLRNKILK